MLELIQDIPLTLDVELGRKRMHIEQLLKIAPGSVIELDTQTNQPLSLYIKDRLVARGEVVVVGDHYGVRILELIPPPKRR